MLVVGAGVAGLTAAELLSRRGFDVTVLEKSDEPGGQINLADKPPHKGKLHWCVEDLVTNAVQNGPKIKYSVAADENVIKEYSPEYIIVATGGNAIKPKAFDKENVVTVTDILNGGVKLSGKNVCVIGSGMTGLETSELLVSQGNKVSVIEMADKSHRVLGFSSLTTLYLSLKRQTQNSTLQQSLRMFCPAQSRCLIQ